MIQLDETVIWKQLSGIYGNSEEIPPLISELAKTNKKETADELIWEYLYHQGSIYESTLASIPHLVKIIKDSDNDTFKMDLILSLGTVLIGYDSSSTLEGVFHEDQLRENLRYRIKTAFVEAIVEFKNIVDNSLEQAKSLDEEEKRWFLVAWLVTRAQHSEADVFNIYNGNEEYMFVCPSCEEETFLWNEDNVLKAYKKDPVSNKDQDPIEIVQQPSNENLKWLENIVGELNIESIKPMLPYFNGRLVCYRCKEEATVFDGILNSV